MLVAGTNFFLVSKSAKKANLINNILYQMKDNFHICFKPFRRLANLCFHKWGSKNSKSISKKKKLMTVKSDNS